MAIRLSGLASNMDTDSIIKQLMSAQSVKLKKITDKQTKNTWIQEKWSALNTKLLNFYKTDVSKMYLQGSYSAKKVTSSNEDKVVATGTSTSPTGSQSLKINKLASGQNVTGAKLQSESGATVTETTKLSDLKGFSGSVGSCINITSGSKLVSLEITDTTTIKDFTNACSNAGLNASLDKNQGRIFISSKESGVDNKFEITTGPKSAITAVNTYKENIGYTSLSSSQKETVDKNLNTLLTSTNSTEISEAQSALKDVVVSQSNTAVSNYALAKALNSVKFNGVNVVTDSSATTTKSGMTEIKDYLKSEYMSSSEYQTFEADINNSTKTDAEKAAAKEQHVTQKTAELFDNVVASLEPEINNTINDIKTNHDYAITEDQVNSITSGDKALLGIQKKDSLTNLTNSIAQIQGSSSDSALKALGLGTIMGSEVTGSGMTVTEASDSEIELNGAVLTGTSNSITANGVTYELKGVTTGDEKITLEVNNNVDDTYKMIKDTLTNYNAILKEMNTLYYAGSSKGYDPLTDDQKSAMSDSEVEKWETKIKDSLLRRDSSLGTVIDGMKMAMQTSVKVNGKSYSLSSFGICTSTDYTEKGLLHIYGDTDDSTYSTEADKLKKALEEDPDAVIGTLSGVFSKLHDTMMEQMKATTMSSTQSFYNDKEYKTLTTDYKKQVTEMQNKLQDMETSYYKKFSSMETALTKLQAQQSQLSSMIS